MIKVEVHDALNVFFDDAANFHPKNSSKFEYAILQQG